jgi:hypothetical protein
LATAPPLSATKILQNHVAQSGGAVAKVDSPRARKFVEENPIVLYDLMQPVFDGRFAGRDAMEYLRILKQESSEAVPSTTVGDDADKTPLETTRSTTPTPTTDIRAQQTQKRVPSRSDQRRPDPNSN